MLRKWKALFAKDRWEILRITYWTYYGQTGIGESKLQLRNRYNDKLKLIRRAGEWHVSDFRNKTYRR